MAKKKTEPVDSDDPIAHELALANEKIRKQEASIKGYKGQVAILQRRYHAPEPAPGETEQETGREEPPTEKVEPPAHFVGPWQQYCADCGDKNPDFKDETKCTACGMHLGSKDAAPKLKACPNCGGKDAEVLKGI